MWSREAGGCVPSKGGSQSNCLSLPWPSSPGRPERYRLRTGLDNMFRAHWSASASACPHIFHLIAVPRLIDGDQVDAPVMKASSLSESLINSDTTQSHVDFRSPRDEGVHDLVLRMPISIADYRKEAFCMLYAIVQNVLHIQPDTVVSGRDVGSRRRRGQGGPELSGRRRSPSSDKRSGYVGSRPSRRRTP